ncbi:MAG: alpha-2-macroglobulin, partial [Flavobacteriales bacterium]
MDKRKTLIGLISLPFLALIIYYFFLSGENVEPPPKKRNPAFSNHIHSFSSGYISNSSNIRVKLSKPLYDTIKGGEKIQKELFAFSPSIDGEAVWQDKRTIVFEPKGKLQPGNKYNAKFILGNLKDVKKELKEFPFQFKTKELHFNIKVTSMSPYNPKDLKWQKIKGKINTTDIVEEDKIKEIFSADQDGKNLPIKWINAGGENHQFKIDSLVRKEEDSSMINFKINGEIANTDVKNEEEFEIPALGDFKVMQTKVVQHPEQHAVLRFSDPLNEKQNLNGLITSNNIEHFKVSVDGNELKVYPSRIQSGSKDIRVSKVLENILGYKIGKKLNIPVQFTQIKPAVRIKTDGVVMPSSKGLLLPFESVNLKAVDVKVVRIFEDNVPQYFQVNNYNDDDELKRVGRLIRRKTVTIDKSEQYDLSKWQRSYLDLSDLIETKPGAIYHVEIGFRKIHSLYNCPGSSNEKNMSAIKEQYWDDHGEEEVGYWSTWNSYYKSYYDHDDYDVEDYNYSEKDNPCTESYYRRRKAVSRNVLASDLGIIAKRGEDNSMHVTVTDIVSTKPLSDVNIKIMDLQQRVMGTVKTNDKGMAKIEKDISKQPFLLKAEKDNQKGYLRLDDGQSLSMSNFDISGKHVQKGLKGFIYGERGVWRPGDSLYLSFMLEDKGKLPANHPVIFKLYNPKNNLYEKIVKTNASNKIYDFRTSTKSDDPTGNWKAEVKVGDAEFTKSLRIETIKPNRLKVELNFKKDKLYKYGKGINATLNSQWLHGATASNLKYSVKASLTKRKTQFENFEDYNFDDPVRTFNNSLQSIDQGKTDRSGVANVTGEIRLHDNTPGMLSANFITKVFEKSGNYSISRTSIPYAPYSSFVGIKTPDGDKHGKLYTDTTNTVKVATVNKDGEPVQKHKLKVKMYKLKWRWWWRSANNDLSAYEGQTSKTPVITQTISTNKNGKGSFDFEIGKHDWGRYLIRITDPQSGHATGDVVYVDWPSWYDKSDKKNPSNASMLVVSSDKEKYNVGEDVEL